MKKVFAIALTLSALGTTHAFAQARNFEGFTLGANMEIDHGSLSATDGSSSSDHSTQLGLQARYDWALGDQFVWGIGATAGTGSRAAGNYASTPNAAAYTRNRYSIDLMPGYALSNTLLVYGKVSALSATAGADDAASTVTVHGTGYGIGLRGLIDHNTYWQAGLDTHRFNDVTFASSTTATFKNDVFSVGMGYRF